MANDFRERIYQPAKDTIYAASSDSPEKTSAPPLITGFNNEYFLK